MNIELVTGCAAAGVMAGWLLDGFSVTIPPYRPLNPPDQVGPTGTQPSEPPSEPRSLGPSPLEPGPRAPARLVTDSPESPPDTAQRTESGDPGNEAVTVASAGPLGPGGPEDEPTGWSDPEPAEPWTLVPASTSGWVERVVVTVVTGALLGLAAYRLGAVPQLGAYCALFVGLVAISAVDLRVGLVPRKILYPTFVLMTIGLVGASAALDAWTPMLHAVIAGVAAFALFFAIWWFHPRGLGFGDVRLAGVMGAGLGWLGLPEAYLGFLAAFLIGALYGLVVMAVQRSGRRTRIAFGPALAAGAVIGVLWGPTLAQTWLHSSGG